MTGAEHLLTTGAANAADCEGLRKLLVDLRRYCADVDPNTAVVMKKTTRIWHSDVRNLFQL